MKLHWKYIGITMTVRFIKKLDLIFLGVEKTLSLFSSKMYKNSWVIQWCMMFMDAIVINKLLTKNRQLSNVYLN